MMCDILKWAMRLVSSAQPAREVVPLQIHVRKTEDVDVRPSRRYLIGQAS
jgi:hypothetical protein